jgi:hypothetical protein
MIVVNMVHLFLPAWRAIRSGEESPNIMFGSVGRVLVVSTVTMVLHTTSINSFAVVALLFCLLYILDDVFAERIPGLH